MARSKKVSGLYGIFTSCKACTIVCRLRSVCASERQTELKACTQTKYAINAGFVSLLSELRNASPLPPLIAVAIDAAAAVATSATITKPKSQSASLAYIADICVCAYVCVCANIIIKRIIITPLSCTLTLENRADDDDCDSGSDVSCCLTLSLIATAAVTRLRICVAFNARNLRTCSHAKHLYALPHSLSLSAVRPAALSQPLCLTTHCFAVSTLSRAASRAFQLCFVVVVAFCSLSIFFLIRILVAACVANRRHVYVLR